MDDLKEKLLNADLLLTDVDGVIGNIIQYAGICATWNAFKNSHCSYENTKLFFQMIKGDANLITKKMNGESELLLFRYFVDYAFKNCPIKWLNTNPKKRIFRGVKSCMQKISHPGLTKIMISRNMDFMIEPYCLNLGFDRIYSNKALVKKENGTDILKGVYLAIPSNKKEITLDILSNYPEKKRIIVIGQYTEDIGIIEAVHEKKDKEYVVTIGFKANKEYKRHADISIKNWGQLEAIIK